MAGEKVNCRQCGAKIRLPAKLPAEASTMPAHAPAEEPGHAPASPNYLCAICQRQFEVSDVYDQQGTVICKTCFAAQQTEVLITEEPIVCASCGSAVLPDQVEKSDGRLMCAKLRLLAAARPTPISPRKKIQKKSSSKLFWIVGGSIAAIVLIAVVLMVRSGGGRGPSAQSTSLATDTKTPPVNALPAVPSPSPSTAPTSDDLMPRLTQLRQRGLDQESAGDLKAAAATYEQMIDLGEHATNPPDGVKSQIEAARTALSAVKERLAAAVPSPATTGPAPASVVAASTQTSPEAPAANMTWEQQHAAPNSPTVQPGRREDGGE